MEKAAAVEREAMTFCHTTRHAPKAVPSLSPAHGVVCSLGPLPTTTTTTLPCVGGSKREARSIMIAGSPLTYSQNRFHKNDIFTPCRTKLDFGLACSSSRRADAVPTGQTGVNCLPSPRGGETVGSWVCRYLCRRVVHVASVRFLQAPARQNGS